MRLFRQKEGGTDALACTEQRGKRQRVFLKDEKAAAKVSAERGVGVGAVQRCSGLEPQVGMQCIRGIPAKGRASMERRESGERAAGKGPLLKYCANVRNTSLINDVFRDFTEKHYRFSSKYVVKLRKSRKTKKM